MLLELFTLTSEEQANLLHGHHDHGLMLLSIGVAILASSFALQVSSLVRVAGTPLSRQIALLSGSIVLGGGIWAMHFIGMLAFTLDIAMSYDPWITLISVLPAILASWVALKLLAESSLDVKAILISGLLVGSGIGTMHYIGMFALRMEARLGLDPLLFIASLIVAVSMAMLAMWVHYALRKLLDVGLVPAFALGGICMGLAISAMHYTGMAAAQFIRTDNTVLLAANDDHTVLAFSISVGILSLGLIVAVTNGILHYRYLLGKIQNSENRLRAIVDTAIDGIITMDAKGSIQSFNHSAEKLLGWQAEEVIGQNIKILMPEPFSSQHDGYLANYARTGKASIIGAGREVSAKHKDGSLIPVRLGVGKTQINNQPLFVGFVTDISIRKAMEQSLRNSEQQYSSLIANIPGVSFRCLPQKEWPMRFISDAVQDLTGWDAKSFTEGGKNFSEVIHPDDAAQVFDEVMAHLDRGQKYNIRYRIICRDGSERWVSEVASASYDEQGDVSWIDGVIVDITETKRRNAEFEGTVNAISRAQGVIDFDLHGYILAINPNAQILCGCSSEALIGQSWQCLFDQDPNVPHVWPLLQQGEFQSGEFRLSGPNREERWIQGHFNPILNADGQPVKVVLLASDLTERRQMVKALQAAKEKAELAVAAKSAFLANMSHEIRTPMNAVIGFSELLLDSTLSDQQYSHLKTVHSSARSLLRLLNDILDTAKLDRGAIELEQQDFSLARLCQELIEVLRLQADSKGLNLVLEYEAQYEWYQGDVLRIRQVLMNLLSNAVKFTERGEVQLRVKDFGRGVSIRIIDTGIGIAADRLQHIFEPFAQADASMSRRFGGTGLGTTIARQLTELMQGSLQVSSTLGQGSMFEVVLPLSMGQPQTGTQSSQAAAPLPPLRVLAADDVEENLELLQITLARAGHSVDLARNGQEAFNLFCQDIYDVVLMDVQMPGTDGLAATRLIRRHETANRLSPTPVIALTASVLDHDRQQAHQAGMDGFASKPLEWVKLEAEITRLLPAITSTVGMATEKESAGKHSPASIPPVLQVINWTDALCRWGDRAALLKALVRFVRQTEDAIGQLAHLLQVQDNPEALALAHKIRGGAANLGLDILSACAASLEQQLAHGLAGSTQALESALQTIAIELKQSGHLHPVNRPGVEAPATESAEFGRLMANTISYLQRGEPASEQLSALLSQLTPQQRSPIIQAIDNFDFDLAVALLEEMADALAEGESHVP